jgi:hypothetical protein
MADTPKHSPFLRFDTSVLPAKDLAKARDNLSSVVAQGDHLWLGGDEGTSIDRMTKDAAGDFAFHRRFDLKGVIDLPGPAKEEIDIEGLDVNGGYLWLVGSHSAKRKKADDEKTPAENLERLGKIEAEGNRFTLARVPLNANSEPVKEHNGFTAARLQGDGAGNLLIEALKKDRHVGRFVPRVLPDKSVEGIPSKDNGLDIEGLAVSGNRVFLGLRGPVLRGWSIILELSVKDAAPGVLALESLGTAGEPYLKHLLALDGLGIRDIVIDGNDLLVLAGPTMDLDGPVFVYRWKNGLTASTDSLVPKADLARVVVVPFGVTKDHAEGITRVSNSPLSLLVCYDSPGDARILDSAVKADVFSIAG